MIDRGDIGAGDFDFEFNFDRIVWESGEASGSDPAGLGGSSARVSWTNGSTASFELTGSGVNGAFLDGGPASTALVANSLNSTVSGRYVFRVRNGVVEQQPTVPEPTTVLLLGSGLLGVGLVGIRRRKTA